MLSLPPQDAKGLTNSAAAGTSFGVQHQRTWGPYVQGQEKGISAPKESEFTFPLLFCSMWVRSAATPALRVDGFQSTNSNANFFQKHLHRHTQKK
jgi:hypothetical protein